MVPCPKEDPSKDEEVMKDEVRRNICRRVSQSCISGENESG
jgi:hypothetical protein